MPKRILPIVISPMRCRRGVTSAEYALMAAGLVALVAVCGQMVAAWFIPTLAAVSGAVGGG